ncbi:hypothetical protein ACFFIX_16415 [Metabacillus herbersteinensis]|uniref:Uncharacterized protein n=1 Tax=Metabacillus herbersteinensis TaxID=283816 RepID=A0ABV6GH62_9BACI
MKKATFLTTWFLLLLVCVIGKQHTTYALSSKGEAFTPFSFQVEAQNWNTVKELLPKGAKFTVIDVESGKSFNVQRRAGSKHADVQPLTGKDTKIMKDIYDGNWSWRRKAVLILTKDKLIAASMHGMPHGAGALENNFPGHFCIHFTGSTTHSKGRADLSHHVMILKAAGQLEEYMKNLSPSKMTEVLLVAIKNGDNGLVKKNTLHLTKLEEEKLIKIEALHWKINSSNTMNITSLETSVLVELKIFIKDAGPITTEVSFPLMRTSPFSPWKIDLEPFLSSLD